MSSCNRNFSSIVVDGDDRAPNRSMLRAVGFEDEDFTKPQVAVCSAWSMVTPCNSHLDELGKASVEGVDQAGGKAVPFGTITVSDGISMGTPGMRYSLVSREVIADSIETVVGAKEWTEWSPSEAATRTCQPASLPWPVSTDRVFLSTAEPFCPASTRTRTGYRLRLRGGRLPCIGSNRPRRARGDREEGHSGPRFLRWNVYGKHHVFGHRGFGHELARQFGPVGVSEDKRKDAQEAGTAVLNLIEQDIKPRDIMTRKAFENAITVVITLGGSTNAVLHLLAMAHAAEVHLELNDFTEIGKRVPVLCDLKPSGKYNMSHFVRIGGLRPLLKTLLDEGLLHGDCMTVTGKTLSENVEGAQPYAPYPDGQDLVRPFHDPIKPDSHLRILYGNLAPEGAVAKITGKEGLRFSGKAIVYESEELP